MVLELAAALEVDGPRLAVRQLLAVVADDVERAEQRLADGALVAHPVLGADVAEAVALGARRSTRARSGPTTRSSAA